jgi:UDP-glucose 4-epimerase
MRDRKKAFIIGGSGFIGSHVADELSSRGVEVTIYDQAQSSYLREDQQFIAGSVLDCDKMIEASKGADYIYNFAAIADIDEAKGKPIQSAEINILGTINALEAAKVNKAQRFVLASSIYVNSSSGSFYRITKQASEAYVKEYHSRYHLPYSILRYGSLYGPRSDQRNTIYRFVAQALKEHKIKYEGPMESIRQYIHAFDAAKLSYEILDEQYANQTFTLTGTETYNINEVVILIEEMLGNSLSIDSLSNPDDDSHYVITPYRHQRDISKKLISNDQISFQEGLLSLISELDKCETVE